MKYIVAICLGMILAALVSILVTLDSIDLNIKASNKAKIAKQKVDTSFVFRKGYTDTVIIKHSK